MSSTSVKGERAPRKRSRPTGEPAPPRKRKQTTAPQALATSELEATPSNPGLGIIAPALPAHPLSLQGVPVEPDAADGSRSPAFMMTMAPNGAPYPNLFAPEGPGVNYGISQSMMANLGRDHGYFSLEHGHLYNHAEMGDQASDCGTPAGGSSVAPTHFIQLPMLSQATGPTSHLATGYLPYITNPYMSNAFRASHSSPIGHSQHQRVHGYTIHPSPQYFDPATGQVFNVPIGGQHYGMPTPMMKPAPMTPGHPPQACSPPQPANAPGAEATSHNHSAILSPTPRPCQGTPRLLSATIPYIGSTPLQPSTPLMAPSQTGVNITPRLVSATLAVPPQNLSAGPPPPALPKRAPTPGARLVTPSTPSRLLRSPDLSSDTSATSDLSSAPPESPSVAPLVAVKRSEPAPPVPPAPMRSMPPQLSADHSACISMSVYTSTMNQLNTARGQMQQLRDQLSKLVAADRPPNEDLVVSIAKRIIDSDSRAKSLKNSEAMILAKLEEVSREKDDAEAQGHSLSNELARSRQQVSEANMSLMRLKEEYSQLEQQSTTHQAEFVKVNGFVHALTTRNNTIEANRAHLIQQLAVRDQELAALRAEVAEAHDKVAHLVSITGINLAELRRESSPAHLVAPLLERSNSHSFPPTPIYTPLQSLPMEGLPLPSQSTLLSDVPSVTSEPLHSPAMPTTPLRSTSLRATTLSPSRFTSRPHHSPRGSIGDGGLGVTLNFDEGESTSPWKSWLQLDTNTTNLNCTN